MAALYSTHCRLHPSSLQSSSSSSSPLSFILQRAAFSSSSKRFATAKVSLKSQPDSHQIPLQTHPHDGATVAPVENVTSSKDLKAKLSPVVSLNEPLSEASFEKDENESTVSITVVGASGDLAKKKIFPALFALYYEGCLPKNFTIYGYARSKMTDAELRNMVSKTLTCRIDKRENCSEKMDQFLERCFYHSGQYDSQKHLKIHLKIIISKAKTCSWRTWNASYFLRILTEIVWYWCILTPKRKFKLPTKHEASLCPCTTTSTSC